MKEEKEERREHRKRIAKRDPWQTYCADKEKSRD